MNVGIGIVAHVKRYNAARALRNDVGAQVISWDYGCLGATENHLSVWRALADMDTEWSIVLEDDALPVKGFREQLDLALPMAPSPVVSLYLGTSMPRCWQTPITRALARAEKLDYHWLRCTHMLHAVAIAVRTPLVHSMIRGIEWRHTPIDERIGTWASKAELPVAYSVPSLVDHADWPTLIDHPDGRPRIHRRVAHRVGTRDEWHSRTTTLVL